MNIIDNVWQVGGEGFSAPGDAAIYLITFGETTALIDAGCGHGHEKVLKNISQYLSLTTIIEYLFLTHCHYDHIGGAGALRKLLRCKIVTHELDDRFSALDDNAITAAAWYNSSISPLKVDHKTRTAKETFRVGTGVIEAIHCPGHSPGSLVFLAIIGGKRVLFAQDVHGPLYPSLLSNSADYIKSLTMLLNIQADILYEGHMRVFKK